MPEFKKIGECKSILVFGRNIHRRIQHYYLEKTFALRKNGTYGVILLLVTDEYHPCACIVDYIFHLLVA